MEWQHKETCPSSSLLSEKCGEFQFSFNLNLLTRWLPVSSDVASVCLQQCGGRGHPITPLLGGDEGADMRVIHNTVWEHVASGGFKGMKYVVIFYLWRQRVSTMFLLFAVKTIIQTQQDKCVQITFTIFVSFGKTLLLHGNCTFWL